MNRPCPTSRTAPPVLAYLSSLAPLREERRRRLALLRFARARAAQESVSALTPAEESEMAAALAALDARLRQREEELAAFLELLPSPVHRAILRLRYCESLPWREVLQALELEGTYITQRHLYRLHRLALAQAEHLYQEVNS